jgi:hypothetical protein
MANLFSNSLSNKNQDYNPELFADDNILVINDEDLKQELALGSCNLQDYLDVFGSIEENS